jgi:hypothetical protein
MSEWLQMGFGLVIQFTEHLQIAATINYSVVANSFTLQFTAVRTKFTQTAVSSAVISWWRILTMSYVHVYVIAEWLLSHSYQLQLYDLKVWGSSQNSLLLSWLPSQDLYC